MEFLWLIAAFVAGYVAAVFTWDRIHTLVLGAEQKIRDLRARARALEQKLGGGL